MNLLLVAALAAGLNCAAAQEAENVAPAPQVATEAAAPAEPQPERTVCNYERTPGNAAPERVCRTVLNLVLRRLPETETQAPVPAQAPPTITAAAPSAER